MQVSKPKVLKSLNSHLTRTKKKIVEDSRRPPENNRTTWKTKACAVQTLLLVRRQRFPSSCSTFNIQKRQLVNARSGRSQPMSWI